MNKMIDKIIKTDILIIGSGGAGASAAIKASECDLSVTIVSKGRMGYCGATVTGEADCDVDGKSLCEFGLPADPRDNQEIFFEDIVRGGKFLSNQKLIEIHVKEAPDRLKELIEWGLRIEKVVKASGHTYKRGAIIPGNILMPILKREVEKRGVNVIEDTMVTNLLTNGGRVVGAAALDIQNGEFIVFKAKAVIMATGGCMGIYPFTTAPEELTGDGYAIAYRAGVELIDMEFPMFIPGAFVWPPALKGVIVPFLLSAAGEVHGWLLNKFGERFMEKWAPKTMEHSTRDIVSVAMMMEILEGRGSPHGGVYVSLKHLPDNLIEDIPNWRPMVKDWKYGGFDLKEFFPLDKLKREAMEAAPYCHFTNGGIKINEKCETNLLGLYAAGEVAGGIHGSNRLSGNAFTAMLVWGARAGRFASEYALKNDFDEININQVEAFKNKIFKVFERNDGFKPIELRKRIQKLAWENCGVIRDEFGLKFAIKEIERMRDDELPRIYLTAKTKVYNKEWVEALQIDNMLLVLEMIARAALLRTESRGAHYRKDYPYTDYKNWNKNIVIRELNGKMDLYTQPVIVTKLKPPEKILPYGVVE